jgi:hypothetical protein
VAEWLGRIGPKDEVTLDEAAVLLDITPDMVTTLIDLSALPARTNGTDTHVSVADIEVYKLRSESDALKTSNLERVRWAHRRLEDAPRPPRARDRRGPHSSSPDTASDAQAGCADAAAG